MKIRIAQSIAALILACSLGISAQEQQQPSQTPPPQQGPTRGETGTSEKQVGTRTKREAAKKEPEQKARQGEPWTKIPIPPLPTFKPQHPKRVQLPNGMVLFLQEDHELPLISLSMRIRGGSRLEPAEKVGLVSLYGGVWRTGGTKTRTGDQLDDFLEARAAKVETGGGVDSTRLGMNCLKADFDDVFAVLLEVLRQPAFREDKLALAKRQMDTGISRRNDDISSVAGREAAVIGYGRDNPYARYPEYSTVAAVTQQDLVAWHEKFVYPNNIILGVDGDFDPAQMEKKLRDAFGTWQKGPQAPTPNISFNPPKPGIYFVAKDDVNQSDIQMLAQGIERKNPDYFALTVMNEVFGGGFSSRLFKSIRTKLGLAYSVGGGVGSAYDHPGLLRLVMGTKTETTAQSVEALYKEVDDMVKTPVTEQELKLAKDAILNAFVFNFDTPEKVLGEQMQYEYYGYPSDFLEQYRTGVEKTTAADVQRVAQKYLHKNELAVLVVGVPDVKQQIAKLGNVTPIDISIPPPPGQQQQSVPGGEPKGGGTQAESQPATSASPTKTAPAKPATKSPPSELKPTASNAEGKALIAKVVQAMGGEAKLQSIKAIREKGTMKLNSPDGPQEVENENLIVYPDRLYSTMQTPDGAIHLIMTSQEAFMYAPAMKVTRDLPSSIRDSGLQEIKRSEVFVAQHAKDPKFIFNADGKQSVNGVQATVLHIDADGAPTTWFVDPTGHVIRQQYSTAEITGLVQRTVDRSEFRTIDGLTLPTKRVSRDDAQETGTATVTEVQLNPTVDLKAFSRPADARTLSPDADEHDHR